MSIAIMKLSTISNQASHKLLLGSGRKVITLNLEAGCKESLVLQLAIRASGSSHVLAQKSFQLQFFCNLNSLKKLHLLIGQVKNRNH